ncbi:MAG: AAA family ATPase [Chloroflexota bacterium]|nr:AAA family ATPase [Chloroflexota bacterium]
MVEKRAIDKLTIKGFKSLQDVEIELGKLNVLIGPNGGGKSNLISYFEMLREMVEENLQLWTGLQDGADRVLTYGAKTTPQLDSYIQFGQNAYQFSLVPRSGDRFVFASELLVMPERNRQPYSLGRGHNEAKLKSQTRPSWEQPRQADYCYASISSWRVYHFHDTGPTARVKKKQDLRDNQTLHVDAANLAPYLYRMQHEYPHIYQEIIDAVQQALPFFRDFVLKPEANDSRAHNILLRWRSMHDYDPFLADQLSDGSLRFICLVTALKQPDPPRTVIFDEPELGLHPYALTLLGSLLDSASEEMQIIVATQSVSLVDEFSVDDLIVVELDDRMSTFQRLDESQFNVWLNDYSVGELWEKNVLGGGLP